MRSNRALASGLVLASLVSAAIWAQSSTATAQAVIGGGSAPATPGAPAPQKPDTFGTTYTSYQRIGFTEFSALDSSMTYSDLAYSSLTFARFPTNANGAGVFVATPHLPSGAVVGAVEFDWCDSNVASDLTLQVWSSSYNGSGATNLGSTTSTGSGGCSFNSLDLSSSPFSIDNNNNQLVLLVYVPTQDGSTAISGAIMRYKLQVSPAPGTATFPDVPTSDFGFQYVEALVGSGITGGCGGGLYCPDAPVTRRQMAIFISKALGLNYH